MIKITSNGKFSCGKKIAFTVDLIANDLDGKRSEVRERLVGKEVAIDGSRYIVKAIESYAIATDYYMDKTALLVEKI